MEENSRKRKFVYAWFALFGLAVVICLIGVSFWLAYEIGGETGVAVWGVLILITGIAYSIAVED